MPDRLPVHVNRKQLHSLEVPPSFETADSFVIEVRNHGEAGRVHLHLDGDLADIASVEANNHYVEAGATQEIPVSLHDHRDGLGKIKLVAGYGATTRWVDVDLSVPDDTGPVVVDEDLAKPGGGRPDAETADGDGGPGTGLSLADAPELPVLGLGAVAVLVALGAAAVFQSTLVTAGAALVVVAVLVAVAMAVT